MGASSIKPAEQNSVIDGYNDGNSTRVKKKKIDNKDIQQF